MTDHNGHVIINGQVFLYRQKAPFVPSGKSVLGALEYDPRVDKLRCHECGQWFKSLGTHVALLHKISGPEYKKKHGLRKRSALVSEDLRTARIQMGRERIPLLHASQNSERRAASRERLLAHPLPRKHTPERRNLTDTCQAQMLAKVRSIAEIVGHTPSVRELRQHGVSPSSLCTTFNMSTGNLSGVMSLLGLQPNSPFQEKFSKPLLIELLRDFYVAHNRLPYYSDFQRGLAPSKHMYQHAFGSYEQACQEAGLGDVYIQQVANFRTKAQRIERKRLAAIEGLNEQGSRTPSTEAIA